MRGHMSKEQKKSLDSGVPRRGWKPRPKNTKPDVWEAPAIVDKPLITQGHVKAAARLQDLLLSPAFVAELAQITEIPDPNQRLRLLLNLAEEHALDLSETSPLGQLGRGETADLTNPDLDFCRVLKRASEIRDGSRGEFYTIQPFDRHAIDLYPVHVCISPLATKRDVLDYVAKRWGEIRWYLDEWEMSPANTRKRPKAERDRFIWERRTMGSRHLAVMVNAMFPGESQDYATINAILKNLKKRYSGK